MYICLCVNVCANMYLCVWYRNSNFQNKSHNNYGSLQKMQNAKLKICCFLQRVAWALVISGLSSLEKFGKCNYRKLCKQIHVYINCIFLIKILVLL